MATKPDKLSANFTRAELECHCGCGMVPTDEAITKLQSLRDLYGKAMVITSAARCAKHNAAIGGAKHSQHVNGIAFDIACNDSADRYRLLSFAIIQGWNGIGIAHNFIHLDDRKGTGLIWLY